MKRPFLILAAAASLLIMSCSLFGSKVPLTPEEQRLQRITHLDTSLTDRVLPDTIPGFDRLAELSAEAWMLVDDSTGLVISQKNAGEKRFMASLTKMMTCLLALENGNMSDTVCILPADCPTRDSRVKAGDSYKLADLVREMMLVSDNNAACAVARHVGGDTLSFCQMMNGKAHYLGMDSTRFANPNGMPNDSNYSCARDLVRLTRYCMADSVFANIVGTAEADLPLTDGRHLPCLNTNQLLTTYAGCIGIKTGYTRQASGCLACAATRDGTTLHLVLLGSRGRVARFSESAVLLDFGFRVMKAYSEATERR